MSALSLPDAKAHLNIEEPTYDTELMARIAAVEAAIAQRVGPLSSSTVTKRVPGYAWNLHLPIYPVVSLTSVTPVGGSALTLADLYLEPDFGTVSFNGSGFFSSNAYDVVYVAGRATVPGDLLDAVKKQLKRAWRDQRGGANRPGQTPSDQVALASQVGALDPEVVALIEPYLLRQTILGA